MSSRHRIQGISASLDYSTRDQELTDLRYRKYKLPDHQNGQVYLTSHRICYVDKTEPRKHSVALDLKSIERFEFYVNITSQPFSVQLLMFIPSGRVPQVVSQNYTYPEGDEALFFAGQVARHRGCPLAEQHILARSTPRWSASRIARGTYSGQQRNVGLHYL